MQDKIKTGTLTFHASYNYGSMLQAYALQQTLLHLGYENEIIDLRNSAQKQLYRRFSPFYARGVKNFLEKVYIKIRFGRALDRQYDRFTAFLNGRMIKSRACSSKVEVERLIQNYDVMICGSDQIWNSACTDFDWSYLLPFEGVGKVAYAPSFGPCFSKSHLTDYYDLYKKNISEYNSLSSREEDGVGIIEKISGRHSVVMPDPSLLLSPPEWNEMAGEKAVVNEPYLFIYAPHQYGKDFKKIAEFLSRKYSLKIVVSNYATLQFAVPAGAEYHLDAGPEQFLNLVKNASLVLCTSFHAVVFSLIFKKPFFAIEGEDDSRIRNILKLFQMESRTISTRSLYNKAESALIMDTSEIDIILSRQKNLGTEYLTKSILDAATCKR